MHDIHYVSSSIIIIISPRPVLLSSHDVTMMQMNYK